MTKKNSSNIVFIYALVDPRTPNDLRYIGKAWDVRERLKQHLTARQLSPDTYKVRWIKKLLAEELSPKVIIIEQVTNETWQERERYWISHYRQLGYRLTNATDGGDGNRGLKMSDAGKAKISKAHKGRQKSETERANLSKARKGKCFLNAETLERIRQVHIGNKYSLGRPVSKETREKIRQSLTGRPGKKGRVVSAETLERLRQSHLGQKKTPEAIAKWRVAIKKTCKLRKEKTQPRLPLF